MSSLKTTTKNRHTTVLPFLKRSFLELVGSAFKVRTGDKHVPCDKESCVMMRRVAVILDILALLPCAEVVERRGSVEAHCGSILLEVLPTNWVYT